MDSSAPEGASPPPRRGRGANSRREGSAPWQVPEPSLLSDGAPAPVNRASGWWIGIIFGVLAGLWSAAPVRYTLESQLEFALSENNLPWMHALDSSRSVTEVRRLNAIADRRPDDYLLRLGNATALSDLRSGADDGPASRFPDIDNDRVLRRLVNLAADFPLSRGADAHLARYMMLNRIRIQRAEIDPSHTSRSIPARRSDVLLMEWALQRGERNDPDNAFWPAMLATTYFAAERDQEGLRELARARRCQSWAAYMHEEVLGQWKLLSEAYGDNGAAQKIGSLSLVAFPHLSEIRRMAELARWHADRAADAGRLEESVRIRRAIAWLGIHMQERAQWSLEALFGTDLLFIATVETGTRLNQNTIQSFQDWRRASAGFLALLGKHHYKNDVFWLEREAQTSCDRRQRVDVARVDTTYPGVPPGIPLASLFGNWMAGVYLLQQMITLIAAALGAYVLVALIGKGRHVSRLTCILFFLVLGGATLSSAQMLLLDLPLPSSAVMFLTGALSLLVIAMEAFHRRFIARSHRSKEPRLTLRAAISAAGDAWTPKSTAILLLCLLAPGLTALYLLRPYLSSMHPVAALLTGLLGADRRTTAVDAMQLALLAGALPLGIILCSSVWAFVRRLSPLGGVCIALRRATFPALVCLVVVYLLVLNRTMAMDAMASKSISEATQNDLDWVLAHGEGDASVQ